MIKSLHSSLYRVKKKDSAARYVAERIPFAFLHPAYRPKTTRDVQSVAHLRRYDTRANILLCREFQTVKDQLTAIAFALMARIDHEKI